MNIIYIQILTQLNLKKMSYTKFINNIVNLRVNEL